MPPVIESIRTRLQARQVGRVGLQVLFTSAFFAPAAANTSLLLAVAAFPFSVADWRSMARQSVVLTFRVHAISLIAPTVVLRFTPPTGMHIHWSGLWAWLQLALFIPVAFFVRADPTHLGRLLLLCVLGLIIDMLVEVGLGAAAGLTLGLLRRQPRRLRLSDPRGSPFSVVPHCWAWFCYVGAGGSARPHAACSGWSVYSYCCRNFSFPNGS